MREADEVGPPGIDADDHPGGPAATRTLPPADPEAVRLRIPTDSMFARVVRVAVGAVAVRHGLDAAPLEDLRIAVDEALILLLRGASRPEAPEDQTVVLDLRSGAHGALLLELTLDPPDPAGDETDDEALARFHELVPPEIAVLDVQPGWRVALRATPPA